MISPSRLNHFDPVKVPPCSCFPTGKILPQFLSNFIKEGLIDEFNFVVNPVMLNKGLRIFELAEHRQKLSMISATAYARGLSVLVYKLNNEAVSKNQQTFP